MRDHFIDQEPFRALVILNFTEAQEINLYLIESLCDLRDEGMREVN